MLKDFGTDVAEADMAKVAKSRKDFMISNVWCSVWILVMVVTREGSDSSYRFLKI